MEYIISKKTTAVPSLPIGKLNDLDKRLDAIEASIIDGTGVAGRIAFFSDPNTLTTESRLTYDSVNGILGVHKIAGDATDGLLIETPNGTDIGILGPANTANVTWYGSHNFNTVTASRVAQFGASKTLESSTVTTTELGYLSGVTSAIQTQIDAKFTLPSLTSGSVLFSNGTTIAQDNANFFWDDTANQLQLGSATILEGSSVNPLVIGRSTNGYIAAYIQNLSSGASASTDLTIGNNLDNGDVTTGAYADFGINSSGFTGTGVISGAGDAYLFNNLEDLKIGTMTAGKTIDFFTAGVTGTAAARNRLTINDTGLLVMDGTAANPSIAFAGSTTTGFYESSAGVLGISIAGTSRGTWSASTFSVNSSDGGTIDIGGTSQYMDFGGTITPSANTFQTVRTSTTWTPAVNRTNAFAFNNQLVLGGSTTGISITTLVGNRSAILTGSGSTIGFTFTDAIAFEARQFVNNSSGTVTGTNEIGFLANNMTNTVSTNKRGFVGELSSGSNKYNLYMSGTAQNWLEGSTGIGISVPTSKLHVVQTGVTTPVMTLSSTATNDDPTDNYLHGRVATNNNTQTTLSTIPVPTDTTIYIESTVRARRTGGTGGTAGDGAGYKIIATYKNIAGTVTLIGAISATHTAEDQAGWDATFTISGTNVLLSVTGATNNQIVWHGTTIYSSVGT